MDPILGAGLISAGGSLLGNLFGFGSQAATNKAQMKLAEYQYEKNLEMWNRQNEYNLPSNQRQRLLDAGLNPALMYGSGHVTNTAGDPPSYDAPHLGSYTNFGDLGASGAINSYLSAAKTNAEIDNIEEDTNVKIWNQQLLQMQRQGVITDIAEKMLAMSRTRVEMKFWEDIAQAGRDKAVQEAENLVKQGEYIDANTRGANASAELTEENAETVRQSRPGIIANIAKEGILLDKQALASVAAANASNASAESSRATAKNQLAQAQKAQTDTRIALEELARLTYRRPEQLEAYVNKKVFEAAKAGRDVREADLRIWMKEYLINTGINPEASGYSGILDKFAHGMNSLIDCTINLFQGNGFSRDVTPKSK